jgi:phospholipase A1/A2
MKMLPLKHLHQKNLLRRYIFVVIFCLLSIFPLFNYAADTSDRFKECAKIDNDRLRLKCFDDLAGRKAPIVDITTAATERSKLEPVSSSPSAAISASDEKEKPSVMSRQWELDPASRKDPFVVRLYRPNYILPWSYNHSPNSDMILDTDRNAESQNVEAKFQISFKVKLWEDILGKNMDLWFAYTQLSFWQVYNKTFSSPFRESNYEPELLLNFRTDYNLLGLRGRIINIGINHQSNGRGQLLSRSWNRITASAGFERNNFNLLLKTWYRLPESRHEDDNREILKYMGYGELWGTYYWKNHRFGIMLRNNLRTSDNKGAIQLDWSFPFPFIKKDRVSGYVQYFNGYGESLLDYDKSINRIGIGLMLMDWN